MNFSNPFVTDNKKDELNTKNNDGKLIDEQISKKKHQEKNNTNKKDKDKIIEARLSKMKQLAKNEDIAAMLGVKVFKNKNNSWDIYYESTIYDSDKTIHNWDLLATNYKNGKLQNGNRETEYLIWYLNHIFTANKYSEINNIDVRNGEPVVVLLNDKNDKFYTENTIGNATKLIEVSHLVSQDLKKQDKNNDEFETDSHIVVTETLKESESEKFTIRPLDNGWGAIYNYNNDSMNYINPIVQNKLTAGTANNTKITETDHGFYIEALETVHNAKKPIEINIETISKEKYEKEKSKKTNK